MIESNNYLFAIRNDIERRKGSEVAIDRRSTIDLVDFRLNLLAELIDEL
jgi:hypothetical protein